MAIEEIQNIVTKHFEFLVHDLGFRGPKINSRNVDFSIGYFSDEIGVEIQVELIGFFIFVLLFEPAGDDIPIGYTNPAGKVQKRHLQEILAELSVIKSSGIKELQELGGDYMNCDLLAEKLSTLLHNNWERIMANREQLFK
jgi:hypothetical protein